MSRLEAHNGTQTINVRRHHLGISRIGSLIWATRRNCGIWRWSRMFTRTQPWRHAPSPHVRRVIHHLVKLAEGVWDTSNCHLAARQLHALGGCSGRRILASSERRRAATRIRRQAATGCGTKMNTVRSCSVSARPLQVRHASRKSPPASAPVDNLDPQNGGTDITGLPPATVTDPSCRPVCCLAWLSADVRNTAHAAQEAATSSARLLSSPSSTSSSGTTPSPGTPVPAHADDATDKAALAAGPQVSMDALERPGDITPNPVQTNAMAASAASDAMSSILLMQPCLRMMPYRHRTPR